MPDVAAFVRRFPPRIEQTEDGHSLALGLCVRLALRCEVDGQAALAELQLGEASRFFPSDGALAAWGAQAQAEGVSVVYGAS